MDTEPTNKEQEIAGEVKKHCTSPNLNLELAKRIFSELSKVSQQKPTGQFNTIAEHPKCKKIKQNTHLETTMNKLPIGSLVLSSHHMNMPTKNSANSKGFYVSFLGFIDIKDGKKHLVYYAPGYSSFGSREETTIEEDYPIIGLTSNGFTANEIVVIEDPALSLELVQHLNSNKRDRHNWITNTLNDLIKLKSNHIQGRLSDEKSDEDASAGSNEKLTRCLMKK